MYPRDAVFIARLRKKKRKKSTYTLNGRKLYVKTTIVIY